MRAKYRTIQRGAPGMPAIQLDAHTAAPFWSVPWSEQLDVGALATTWTGETLQGWVFMHKCHPLRDRCEARIS